MADTDDVITVTTTIELSEARLERLLDGVEEGRHASLDKSIEAEVDAENRSDAWMYRW